jgi:hypothetical protein
VTGALTLRRVGIAGAVAGAVALVAPFAPDTWSWFWPDPMATIDVPGPVESRAGCFVMSGRLDPRTFWRRPLWLIRAQGGEGWQPVTRIVPWIETWQYPVCLHGRTGGYNRFALVVADAERNDAFRRQLAGPAEEPIPAWLSRRDTGEQGGGCPGHRLGFAAIPEGARLVALAQVRLRQGDELPCSMGRISSDDPWPSGTDEGQGRRRRDERRVLRSRHGLQRAVARGVAAGGDGVGGRRP